MPLLEPARQVVTFEVKSMGLVSTGACGFCLNRIELTKPFGERVLREHKLLAELGQRIRDVRQGPDGLIYVLTDQTQGRLIRLLP